MIELTLLDWFWLLLYSVLMIGCGILFYELGKRSQEDFFLAGRNLPWYTPTRERRRVVTNASRNRVLSCRGRRVR